MWVQKGNTMQLDMKEISKTIFTKDIIIVHTENLTEFTIKLLELMS